MRTNCTATGSGPPASLWADYVVRYRYEGGSGPLPTWVSRRAWRSQTRAVLDGLARELERRAADAR